MLEGLGTALSLVGALQGGGEGEPGGSQTFNHYQSMPQWLKDAYEQHFGPEAVKWFNSPESRLNETQLNALNAQGQGIKDINANLGEYMNPFQEAVTNNINKAYNAQQNNLNSGYNTKGRIGGIGSGGFFQAHLGNEQNRQNALANANYENYNQALGLRRQTLSDMLNAGTFQQQAPFQRLQQFGGLLGQVPGGPTSQVTNPQAAAPNQLQRLGGLASGLGSAYTNGAFNSFGFNPSGFGQYGPQQPGIFSNLFGR